MISVVNLFDKGHEGFFFFYSSKRMILLRQEKELQGRAGHEKERVQSAL